MSVNQEIGTSVSKKVEKGVHMVFLTKERKGVGWGFECRGDTMEDIMIIDFCENFV